MGKRLNSMHLDATESAFFKRQLEYIKAKTYDTKYKELKALNILPISTEAPAGATEITYRSYSLYGQAKMIADYAHDFPRVDTFGTETTVQVKDIGASYGYSLKEIRSAAMAGLDLEPRRARVARRAVDELINTIALTGHTNTNLKGFVNYSGLTEYTVPLNAGATSKTWALKTAAEIQTDLLGIINAIAVATNGRERPNIILMPLVQYNLIRSTRVSTDYADTIYTQFVKNNPDIRLDYLNELDGAGAGDTDRYMALKLSPDYITLEIPIPYEVLEEEKSGMEYVIPVHASTAGVIIYYPTAFAFGDGI